MKCLALGNSITTHGKCSYWWSKAGMAASDELHDYCHLLKKYIDDYKQDTENIIKVYNYYVWELQYLGQR